MTNAPASADLSEAAYRLLLVEDHDFMLDALTSPFEEENMQFVGIVGSKAAAVERLKTDRPDAVILDVDLENGEDGRDVLAALLELSPELPAVVFTYHTSDAILASCYSAGAKAVVCKRDGASALVTAMCAVRKGQVYFAPGRADRIALFMTQHRDQDPRTVLNETERKTFLAWVRDPDISANADELGIAASTLESRLKQIAGKLGQSRKTWYLLALQYGMDIGKG